ncbi:NAD(P)/FAD-dependent oxidoreductase [Robbsia sp. Bb-Pol-6]|uniref:NAD(P)/FAD-dependent oxidoreductase n=1 Tax=Robbsia betulipollinis TaxID=2981849 RepID=A0ABT3ZRS2_9BURK|nr:NAD(P)/FAD-dependent oxidoreductase [Robbsia betulipollinis]MCY0389263.1 NAD(P)/FAD-dependent oxidoreductase [Robbsia betulipollinis]
MAPRIVVIGTGPAGVRAAQALADAGLRPTVIDEGSRDGGQIYRRQPSGFTRSYETLYGSEAKKASALHQCFDALRQQDRIDYLPDTLVWNIAPGMLYLAGGTRYSTRPFDALIVCSGATDRLMPVLGWDLAGAYSLGGAQVALKSQGCAIGRRTVLMGTGPLLYLVAAQYTQAGAQIAAVLDTSTSLQRLRALPGLLAVPAALGKGAALIALLRRAGVPIHRGVTPRAIHGSAEHGVTGVAVTLRDGRAFEVACDAVGMGYHLRPETQLADLAGCTFAFDAAVQQWLPEIDTDGRSSVPGVYLAGDGARVRGADAAEASGRLAALAVLLDRSASGTAGTAATGMTATGTAATAGGTGGSTAGGTGGGTAGGKAIDVAALTAQAVVLRRDLARLGRFAAGLRTAFPWPSALAATLPDAAVVCRCEAITAGELRRVVRETGAREANRAKAFSRVGMGRCQGRFCAHAGAEIIAAEARVPLATVGRLRGQAPVRPLPMALAVETETGTDVADAARVAAANGVADIESAGTVDGVDATEGVDAADDAGLAGSTGTAGGASGQHAHADGMAVARATAIVTPPEPRA